jgi:NAD(P)-dependent dehydrogenase (short-subunit alcohol dehydrogenase family)
VALITGASRGLGRALANTLHQNGWSLVLDARRADDLTALSTRLSSAVAVVGDVTDHSHRTELVAAVGSLGGLDLLVNNASSLGVTPLPALAEYPMPDLRSVYETNVFAPLALTQLLLPSLRSAAGAVVNVSSDAAVEAYGGWGGYGSSKAALDQISAVLAVEEPAIRIYAVDPGDMRTDMHQSAFPDEDISDRPEPETVVAPVLRLVQARPASGRYRAADWAVARTAR